MIKLQNICDSIKNPNDFPNSMKRSDQCHAYRGNENYIFISYCHKDSAIVLPIITVLQTKGFRIWYDEGIDPGTEWDEKIAMHVKNCTLFIAFISKEYIKSSNCKDELHFARDCDKSRLLIYIEDVTLPDGMQMRLGRLQAIHKYSYKSEDLFYNKLMETPELTTCIEKQSNVPETTTSLKSDNYFFKATFSSESGGSLFFYSKNSSLDNLVQINVTDEMWNNFIDACKKLLIVVIPDISYKHISITRNKPLGIYSCAPTDGHSYYDPQYRIDFTIKYIHGRGPKQYDSVRFDIFDSFKICLFYKGDYVFKIPSESTTLSDYGINEKALHHAAKNMIEFILPNQNIIFSDNFRRKVYSDCSGGYYLDYICED